MWCTPRSEGVVFHIRGALLHLIRMQPEPGFIQPRGSISFEIKSGEDDAVLVLSIHDASDYLMLEAQELDQLLTSLAFVVLAFGRSRVE